MKEMACGRTVILFLLVASLPFSYTKKLNVDRNVLLIVGKHQRSLSYRFAVGEQRNMCCMNVLECSRRRRFREQRVRERSYSYVGVAVVGGSRTDIRQCIHRCQQLFPQSRFYIHRSPTASERSVLYCGRDTVTTQMYRLNYFRHVWIASR